MREEGVSQEHHVTLLIPLLWGEHRLEGKWGGVTLIPLPQLRSLLCTESQFRPPCFSFSNKKTLLALCLAVKLTLSHCAYDSQRESVSSHSSLSPAVDP